MDLFKRPVIFLTLLIFPLYAGLSGCINEKSDGTNLLKADVIQPGQWKFDGHLGKYIDKIAHARILDKANWDVIYPETEEAFALKEDDKNYPESGQWRGEFWGKYILSAIAAARYYHSEELKKRIAGAVKGLLSHMDKNGYLGTYQHPGFVKGNNWNIWTRKYTLWGLLEAWELLDDPAILRSAGKFTDQLMTVVGPGKTDIILTGNFYGMPSTSILYPIVKLYIATGEQKYLGFAEYIVRQWSQHPDGLPDILNNGLSGRPVHTWSSDKDPYQWAKGYELTSCVEGLAELYKVTGNQQYLTAVKNIHEAISEYERSPAGSVSFNDKYAGSAGLINTVAEICDAVYWNRLSFQLFQLTGDEKYMDELERTLYNALLCAFNRQGTWGLRRLRMSHIHIPATNHFLQHHQCCTDNLPRGLFQASGAVLMKKGDREIYLNLFNAGHGSIRTQNDLIRLNIEGDFLLPQGIKVSIDPDHPVEFTLVLRLPAWSDKTEVRVNGKVMTSGISNHLQKITRKWKQGDVIRIAFDLKPHWVYFHPEQFDSTFHGIGFYDAAWAGMHYAKGSNEALNREYGHVVPLDQKDALPRQKAVTFYYGPLALARDVRVSGPDIFSPLPDPGKAHSLSIKPVSPPPGIWQEYEIRLDGKAIRFCDFSSAGNTWDNRSLFNTWCIVEKLNE